MDGDGRGTVEVMTWYASAMLRKVKLSEVKPFDYSFGGPIRAKMADVGRTLGSGAIGLTIQTVAPGCFSSRRHKHVFQEEILIVLEGDGPSGKRKEPAISLSMPPGPHVAHACTSAGSAPMSMRLAFTQ